MEKPKNKERKKRSPEEIEKQKAMLRAKLENVNVSDIINDTETKGERHFAREFKKLYNGVRKALVLLSQKRSLKMITNEEAYNEALLLLDEFIPE